MKRKIVFFAALAAFVLAAFSCKEGARLSKASLEMQEKFGAKSAEDFCRLGAAFFYGWDGFPVDYEKSLALFKDAAKMQSGEACFWIAEFYKGGYACKQNYKKAARWLEKAAALGYEESYFRLGVLYEYGGHGLKADKEKSRRWYEMAKPRE